MSHSPFEELQDAAEHLRQAADSAARRMFGSEVQDELRQAGLHVVRAARHALQRAEDCFAKPQHGGGCQTHDVPGEQASPASKTDAPSGES